MRALPFAFATSLLAVSSSVLAAQRTFVALTGTDTGVCSAATPCRTLAFALGQTIDGGEIVVLESGGYGSLTITKSVAITVPEGVYGGISAFTGNAVTVNAAAVNVMISGLALTGLGADNGVAVLASSVVRLDRCTISGFIGDGVVATSGGELSVERSRIRDNTGGITVGGTQRVIIDDSIIEDNGTELNSHYGVGVTGSANVTVQRSRISRNAYGNIRVAANAGDTARIEVVDSLLSDGLMQGASGPGLYVIASGAGANVYAIATRNTVRNNFHGLLAVSDSSDATATLIATKNISTAHPGSWAYGAEGSGTTLVLSGNVASQSLWGIYNYNGQATVRSTGDNVVQDAGIGSASTPPALF